MSDRPQPPAHDLPSRRGQPLVVVGASVRSFAQSAARCGRTVHAADLFADQDLVAVATATVQVAAAGYPGNLAAAVSRCPSAPWCYTGGLENHPQVIDLIAAARPLAGNDGRAVRSVRDPTMLAATLRAADLLHPPTFLSSAGVPTDGSHLVKPLRSAGGRGIATWHGEAAVPAAASRSADRIWQRFVPGEPWSASFLLASGVGRLVGASRQLLGEPWCGARGFAYCGSIDAPLSTLAEEIRRPCERLGHVLAADLGLVGLVGADLIVDHHGRLHVIEVNPRPTASMELVERSTGESLAAMHLSACTAGIPAAGGAAATGAAKIWSKAIVFNGHDLVVDDRHLAAVHGAAAAWTPVDDGWPAVADIPAPGTLVPAHAPLLTVFAVAATAAESLATLQHRTAIIRRTVSAGETPWR